MIPKATLLQFETQDDAKLEVINGKVDAFVYDLPYNAIFASQNQGAVVHPGQTVHLRAAGLGHPQGDQDTLNWLEQLPAPDQGRRQLRPSLQEVVRVHRLAEPAQITSQRGGMPPFTQNLHNNDKRGCDSDQPQNHKTDGKTAQPAALARGLPAAGAGRHYRHLQGRAGGGLHLALGTHSQYIAYQAEQKHYAEFDGTVVAEKGQLFLQDDLDPSRRQAIAAQGAQLAEGDTVFLGDTLDVQLSWTAGPIAWGVWVTVKLSLVAGSSPSLLGTLAGLATLPNPALRNLAVTYVELIRGTPLLVQIFIVYFFIGTVLNLDRFTAGVAALAVFTGAYVAEIVRAGISSIHKGQMEAGRSLGMTSAQTMRYVILPQAFKRVLLPPLMGQFINLIRTRPGLGHLHHGSHQGGARGGQLHLQPVRGVVHRGPALSGADWHSLLPGASSGGEICAQQLIPYQGQPLSRRSAITGTPCPSWYAVSR